MKFRQRVAWLMAVIYLGGTFAFIYYIFEINEHYNAFAIDHVQKFHTKKAGETEMDTQADESSILHALWCHLMDLPLSVWILLMLCPYCQVFLMILACTRPEPKLHIAFLWPGLIYLKYQQFFGKSKPAIIPIDNAHTKSNVRNGHTVLHT